MQGLYVDNNNSVVLVCKEDSFYRVIGCKPFEKVGERGGGEEEEEVNWFAICEEGKNNVVLKEKEGTQLSGNMLLGGCIRFEDGKEWSPLYMTDLQVRYLSRRPYVPLTYIFFSLIYTLFYRLKMVFTSFRGKKDE